MRRRQVAITLSSGIVLGMSCALYFGCHSEPSSHGYSLGHLLATYVRIYQGYLTTPGWQDTRQYVREIGTNGVPQMLRWLAEERPQWKVKAFDFHEKQLPSILKTKLIHNWLSGDREELHAKAGSYGFEILGPIAVPALPSLERMASDSKHPARSARAINAMKNIGKDAVPALVRILIAPNSTNRFQVFEILGSMGTNAAPAVQLLIELLKYKDVDIAGSAIILLGKLGLSPATVVPAIAELADHPKIHYLASSTLVDFGSEARPAIPRLVQCLTNIDHDIAITAARALARIKLEPELAVPGLIRCLKTHDADLQHAATVALNQYLWPDLAAERAQHEELSRLRALWFANVMKSITNEPPANGGNHTYYRSRDLDRLPNLTFIIASLTNLNLELRQEAIIALGQRAKQTPSAARALLDCLDDNPREIAIIAAQTLSESRLESDAVIPFLVDWLDIPELRLTAIVALAEYGERARPAIPALQKLLGGLDDKFVRPALEVIESNAPEKIVAQP
jgi:HEAT repeat protein